MAYLFGGIVLVVGFIAIWALVLSSIKIKREGGLLGPVKYQNESERLGEKFSEMIFGLMLLLFAIYLLVLIFSPAKKSESKAQPQESAPKGTQRSLRNDREDKVKNVESPPVKSNPIVISEAPLGLEGGQPGSDAFNRLASAIKPPNHQNSPPEQSYTDLVQQQEIKGAYAGTDPIVRCRFDIPKKTLETQAEKDTWIRMLNAAGGDAQKALNPLLKEQGVLVVLF